MRRIVPLSGASMPASSRRSVDLPAPFGPTSPIRACGGTTRSTPARTTCAPWDFETPVAASTDDLQTRAGRGRGRRSVAVSSVGHGRRERAAGHSTAAVRDPRTPTAAPPRAARARTHGPRRALRRRQACVRREEARDYDGAGRRQRPSPVACTSSSSRLGSQNATSNSGLPMLAWFQSKISARPSRRQRLSPRTSPCTTASPSSCVAAASATAPAALLRATYAIRVGAEETAPDPMRQPTNPTIASSASLGSGARTSSRGNLVAPQAPHRRRRDATAAARCAGDSPRARAGACPRLCTQHLRGEGALERVIPYARPAARSGTAPSGQSFRNARRPSASTTIQCSFTDQPPLVTWSIRRRNRTKNALRVDDYLRLYFKGTISARAPAAPGRTPRAASPRTAPSSGRAVRASASRGSGTRPREA